MKRLLIPALLCVSIAFGQDFRLGSKVTDFPLKDLNGAAVSFSELKGSTTVVTFISTTCPISNSYDERMNAAFKDYSAMGVHFIFINSNANESADQVREHAKRVGFAFPVYKDMGNKVADMFGAMATPESYVIDATGTIRYHGYIDDSSFEPRVTRKGLRNALDAVLAGKDVERPETKAFGCTIKRARQAS